MSTALESALQAVRDMRGNPCRDPKIMNEKPATLARGWYTAETLGKMEASHKRLIETAVDALAYLNPHLYTHAAIKRAVDQAEKIRREIGLQ